MAQPLSPTIAHLRSFPQNRNRRPQAAPAHQPKLTRALATRFCDLLAQSDKPLFQLIDENPGLPHHKTLFNWQQRVPWFNAMWKDARIRQSHFLFEKCLDLYQQACPKTAHVVRVRFDVLKWAAAKLNPSDYGDKPQQQQQSTTVNVGISISPERLTELRSKLDSTRSVLSFQTSPSKRESASRTRLTNGSEQPEKDVTHQK